MMCVPSIDPCPLAVEVEDIDLRLSTHSLCDEKFRTVLVGEREELPLLQAHYQNTNLHNEIVEEIFALGRISAPSTITGLLSYARNLVSMLFLGHLGHVELAAGALSIGFANITSYSIIFGLAMGMEPICGQAFGAQKHALLTLTLYRTIAFLLLISIPITFLWLNVDKILLLLDQEPEITSLAKIYLLYALPDLFLQCILNPFRIYLRSQNITNPIALCSFVASLIHITVNHYLVNVLKTGIKGVAMGVVVANFSLTMLLLCYACASEACKEARTSTLSFDCFREWGTIIRLAVPSCISVCLEWWWYELMIILCGLLSGPQVTVSAIGVLMQMTALVYVFPSSLSYGVSTRVAQELGAGRPKRARKASMIGAVFGAGLGIAAMAFNIWARAWWGPMFTDRGPVLKLVSIALPIIGLCELGNCPQTAMCGALRGCAQANVGAHINLGGFYGVGLPVALLFGFWMGLGFVGLWMGLLAAQASCAAVLATVLMRTDWAAEAARAKELTSGEQVLKLDETIDDKGGKENLKGMVGP